MARCRHHPGGGDRWIVLVARRRRNLLSGARLPAESLTAWEVRPAKLATSAEPGASSTPRRAWRTASSNSSDARRRRLRKVWASALSRSSASARSVCARFLQRLLAAISEPDGISRGPRRKTMCSTIRDLNIRRQTQLSLADIARTLNPLTRGWIDYYGRYAPRSCRRPLGKCGHTSPFWRMVTNLVVGGRRAEPVNDLMLSSRFDGNRVRRQGRPRAK